MTYFYKSMLYVIIILVHTASFSQHQELSEKPATWGNRTAIADSSSLLNAFKNGHFNGHFRYFFMNTNNQKGLSDYYANAVGGGVKYETAKYHHFQFGVSGFYIFNVASSDLTKPDGITNQMNRYEIALFDISNPTNKKNIDRLEELYLKYHLKNSTLTFGKQLINTPFINLQDGRMRPTEVEGFWAEINDVYRAKIEVGYIYGISPRSTVEFVDVGKSIGIYPQGRNTNGTVGDYAHNIESKGILILAVTKDLDKNVKMQVWHQWVENVFNTSMVELSLQKTLKQNSKLILGLQSVYQASCNDGGNKDQSKTYFNKDGKSFTYGLKVGYAKHKTDVSINYNRITSVGRFLMPREWGREPFYTFMPRERNEGLGDVNAIAIKMNQNINESKLRAGFGVGYYSLPDVNNFFLNKYGMPSYTQLNLDLRYKFSGVLDGFDLQFLFVHKINNSNKTIMDRNKINKVDMSNLNFILNFHF